jgi:alpha-2-macroglobulin
VLSLGVALVVSACGTTEPSPSATLATPDAGRSQDPAPSGEPSNEAWAAVDLPPLAAAASLEPTKAGVAGAAVDTGFRLRSLDGSSVTALSTGLTVEPALTLRADPPSGDSIVFHPAAALAAGTTYRFKLRRQDGTLAGAWSVTAARPLHVVGTLPGDQTADVPVDTGIEVTFDQAGVTADGLRASFKTSPAVDGRFEVHGRVVAFIPAAPLKKLTVYTLTVRHGLSLPGTGQVLQQDVVARFETSGSATGQGRLFVPVKLADAGTKDAPAVGIAFVDMNDVALPKTLPIRVYRLAGLPSAIDVYGRLVTAGDWARSGGAPIDTRTLTEALRATVRFHKFTESDGSGWIQLPRALAAGWYVVTITFAGAHSQALIQVTDVATYALVTDTRTVVWTNDVRTGRAIAGASVTLGATGLGRTGADGLRVTKTPHSATVLPGDTNPLILTIRDRAGRAMFVPVDRRGVCGKCDLSPSGQDEIDAWWHVLGLDRSLFHPTDHANIWGIVRARDGGARPKTLDVRLVSTDETGEAGAPLVVEHPNPNAAGAFVADIAFRDLPPGDYRIQLRADGSLVDEAFFTVGTIVKPGYTLEVVPDKRAVVAGEVVAATVHAAFFEGTPVAGVQLGIGFPNAESDGAVPSPTVALTAPDGIATATVRADLEGSASDEQWAWRDVTATPRLPEEAGIRGSTPVAVFRSTALLGAAAVRSGQRLDVTGTVNDVAFDRFVIEPGSTGAEVDPVGSPRPGAKVDLHVVEIIQTRKEVGTQYDFITKRTVPFYQYDERRVDLGDRTATTAADGSFHLAMTVPGGSDAYEIDASYRDEGGRAIGATTFAAAPAVADSLTRSPRLVVPGKPDSDATYSVGDSVRVAFLGGHSDPGHDRYLFSVTHRGLRSAVVQSGPAFTTRFGSGSVPNESIDAVRFTGSTYEVANGYEATFRVDDRRLAVVVTPDAAQYAPGGRVDLTVRTTDAGGKPVAASVVVRVIDEKLYAIQAAADLDPLGELYRGVSNGVVATAWSHRPITADFGDGGGDTTGGGGRDDFRDWLLFRLVTTRADGIARLSFDLSDDLTAWRVSAAAIDTSFRAGAGTVRIPVGLPFFAEATIAPEYLASDHPIIRLRGFGTGLARGDRVTFEVSAPTLGMAPTRTEAAAFATAEMPLPGLTPGDHQIRIVASTGTGADQRQDVVVRTIHVIASRAIQTRTASEHLDSGFVLHGGSTGLTTVVLSDAGRGRVLPILLSLNGGQNGRADEAIAGALARRVLHGSFGMSPVELGPPDADLSSFQIPGGGIALLPYASEDLELSALAALADDARLDPVALDRMLRSVLDDRDASRERRIVAMAGLAALGQPVLDMVRTTAAEPALAPTERAWLAIAALAGGDEILAGHLERALLGSSGQRLGPWVRLSLGDRETSVTTTALVAIVASGIGDPLAPDLDAYLAANPPKDTLIALQEALAARFWVERMPGAAAAVSVTVDGASREVSIDPRAPVWLTFTPAQVSTVHISTVRGDVLVASTWDGPLDAPSLHAASGMSFDRTVTPTGPVAADGLVTVDFSVNLGDDPDSGCWRVTDLVPSGLAPLAAPPIWPSEDAPADMEGPWRISGQRVDFCVTNDPKTPLHHLRYVARVITAGTYAWEPAVLQSSVIPERGIVLPSSEVLINRSN